MGRWGRYLVQGFGPVLLLAALSGPAAAQRLGVISGASLPYQTGAEGNFSPNDLRKGKRMAPDLLKAAKTACTVTDAAYLGSTWAKDAGGRSDGRVEIYEAACAGGLGYLISTQKDKPPLVFDCVAAQASKNACMLPANRHPAMGLDGALSAAGVVCAAQRARLIAQDGSAGLRRYEVACEAGGGYILDIPLPDGAGAAPAAADCLQNADLCRFTPHVESVAMLAHQIAPALGPGCQISDARYVGYVGAHHSDLYELGCGKGQDGRLVELDRGVLVRSQACGGVRLVGASCQLKPAERVDPLIAHAQASGAAAPLVVTDPQWARRPSGDDLASLYPRAAAAGRVTGQATIGCLIGDAGRLRDCFVADESPAGYAFGQAALGMADKFRLKPGLEDGAAVNGQHVLIPITFALN